MTVPPASASAWTVGELARATGLSVRVLRHWEQVGLVAPVRTSSGHRRYGPDEITCLYRAMALRRTGLSLRRIAALLQQQDPDPEATLRSHLAEINDDLCLRTELRDRLAGVLAGLETDSDPAQVAADPELLMRVIETMSMFDQYVHGYQSQENRRLSDQAGTLVDLVHGGVAFPPGISVLEVGCGVGAQTIVLAQRSPDALLTSVDISSSSLLEAERRVQAAGITNITFATANVYDLPHAAGPLSAELFDHVFVCFLLEHLPRPVEALRRLGQMIKPGGTITVVEGDHGSTYFHPDSDAARAAIACQVRLQTHAGGDALIGRRLYPLLIDAGYSAVCVEPRMVYVDASRPDLVDGFIRKTFTAMIAGIREPAISGGPITPEHFDQGIQDLERTAEPDGVFCYTFFRAIASS